jgi:hypothetical protein
VPPAALASGPALPWPQPPLRPPAPWASVRSAHALPPEQAKERAKGTAWVQNLLLAGGCERAQKRKRSRPPSWARKAWRVRKHAHAAVVDVVHGGVGHMPGNQDRKYTDPLLCKAPRSVQLPPVAASDEKCLQAQRGKARAETAAHGQPAKREGRGLWTSRRGTGAGMLVLRPSKDMLPKRASLFQAPWPSRRGLPAGHPLSRLPTGAASGHQLMRAIWGRNAPSWTTCHTHDVTSDTGVRLHAAQQHAVLPLLQGLLERSKTMPWLPMLESLCPITDEKSTGSGYRRSGQVLSLACPQHQVCAFIRAVLGRLMPPALLGASKRKFLAHISTFLALRKHEEMSVHALMQGMATQSPLWLSCLCAPPCSS